MTPSIPAVSLTYDLADVATSIGNWLSPMWPIVAFAIGIPLAFLVAHRIKNLFMA